MQTTSLRIILLCLLCGTMLLWGCNDSEYFRWQEDYQPDSKEPYGTFLIKNLLESYYPDKPFYVLEDSLGDLHKEGNFVYIGSNFRLDSVEIETLLSFAERGNRVLIIAQDVSYDLLHLVAGDPCFDSFFSDDEVYQADIYHVLVDSVVALNFKHPNLRDKEGYPCRFIYYYLPFSYYWDSFSDYYFGEAQTSFTVLGQINDEAINFIKGNYGKGEFYFHTTPMAFTNLNLKEKSGLEYASKVFSHLKSGPIYWDQRIPEWYQSPNPGIAGDSPLKYILSQRALAWAWYILLGLALLYLLFRARRRQRIIPVLEQNENTSLEFVGTIGRLFFLQRDYRRLVLQKMKLFFNFVRERYRLPTRELDEVFAKNLAQLSEVPEQEVNKILLLCRNINRSNYLSENVLLEFHQITEQFYKTCK